jgi:hypothetical protein
VTPAEKDAKKPDETAAETEEAAPPEKPKPSGTFNLISGAKIEHGKRSGTVAKVRGNGPEPYEVQIRWEGEKYPEWHLFAALKQAWSQGEFCIVKQGRESLLSKLMPF